MIIIGAFCSGGGVGYKGGLPWKNSKDLKHFKKTTMGKTILVGKKTWEKMPPLKGRTVTVLSRGINDLSEIAKNCDTSDMYLIGGPTVWKYALERGYVQKAILTHIDSPLKIKCDAYFPFEYMKDFDIISADCLDKNTTVLTYVISSRMKNKNELKE